MQNEKILLKSIRSQSAHPISFMSGLRSTPSETFSNEWNKIIQYAFDFWERCEKVSASDDGFTYRRLNDEALEWLKPVIEDIAWIQVVRPSDYYTHANRLMDFRYKFVGNNLIAYNGRQFQGDQLLDRARVVAKSFGSGGMQSHLYTLLAEVAATGRLKFLYTQYVNPNMVTCDMHFAPLPVANGADEITDFFCPMLIRPASGQ